MTFLDMNEKEEFFLNAGGLQENLLRKLARKYSNPFLTIKIKKLPSLARVFKVTIDGQHLANLITFKKELKENNFTSFEPFTKSY